MCGGGGGGGEGEYGIVGDDEEERGISIASIASPPHHDPEEAHKVVAVFPGWLFGTF